MQAGLPRRYGALCSPRNCWPAAAPGMESRSPAGTACPTKLKLPRDAEKEKGTQFPVMGDLETCPLFTRSRQLLFIKVYSKQTSADAIKPAAASPNTIAMCHERESRTRRGSLRTRKIARWHIRLSPRKAGMKRKTEFKTRKGSHIGRPRRDCTLCARGPKWLHYREPALLSSFRFRNGISVPSFWIPNTFPQGLPLDSWFRSAADDLSAQPVP